MDINELKLKNPNIKLYSSEDKEFLKYGRLIENIDTKQLIETACEIKMPNTGSAYNASQSEFENLSGLNAEFSKKVYGEMPIQIGFCYGFNNKLNGLEWHKGNEVNVAVTDFVLLLGLLCDIENGKYNSEKVKGFYIKKGQTVEVFENTLHYCPCQTSDNGFKSVVVLPKETNLPLDFAPNDDYLYAKNKWIISHIDNKPLIEKGVFGGIYGENYKVNY